MPGIGKQQRTVLRQGWGALQRFAISTGQAIEETFNEEHIRVAVTGLSRAGKTVFITSLVHNLLALGAGRNTLPQLAVRLTASANSRSALRLVEATVLPPGAEAVPQFDYGGHLASLSADPAVWPGHTEDLAQISLLLTLERRTAIRQRLGRRRVRLDILDYPGEWLLDLPLLRQDFAAWSETTFALLRQSPRREACDAFLRFVDGVHPADRADEAIARQGHALYRAGLEKCRADHGLRYLQPGRFLCPGRRGDVPFMCFFPMENQSGEAGRGSLGALLSDRFEAYKRDMRASFFDPWFGLFDRQVMLVDVLDALYAGQAAFDDTARALRDIARALRYGEHYGVLQEAADWLRQGARHLLPAALNGTGGSVGTSSGGRRIERVVFAATKADHVPALKRDNLRHLLRALSEPVVFRQSGLGASVTHQVVASLLSTEDGSAKLDGRPVQVVRGVTLGEDKVRPFYVGEVPTSVPGSDFWAETFFELPRFCPPIIDPSGEKGLPHIGLDMVLDDLIGDLL